MTIPITQRERKIICDAYLYMLDRMDFTYDMFNNLGCLVLYLIKSDNDNSIVIDTTLQTVNDLNDILCEYFLDVRDRETNGYGLGDVKALSGYISIVLEGELK